MRCQKARKFVSLAMDNRLDPVSRREMQDHLHGCHACLDWQREQTGLQELFRVTREAELSPGFHAGLMRRIAGQRDRRQPISLLFARTILLRAAAMLLIVMAALFGLFLGGRLNPAAPADGSAAVGQALNLDVFADLPGDSFGAVYEGLLQGEIR